MIGDKLIIEQHHTDLADELCIRLLPQIKRGFTISIAGESGAGKSEIASEMRRIFNERGIASGVLQQDDYFVFPPRTNHEMRQHNIAQVGTYEVKLDFLDANLRSFKRNETLLYKPLVVFDDDRITTEEFDTEGFNVLIAEGTYTSLLKFVDYRVFIDRDYHRTLDIRKRRARDQFDPFITDVLEIEHQIIAKHKSLADAVISTGFDSITYP